MSKQNPQSPSTRSLVMIPAILTLVVTLLRLIGELLGWNETWFGTGVGEPGPDGEARSPGLFGIVWLVPIFGAYFGYRIRSAFGGPQLGRSLGMFVVAILLSAGGVFLLVMMGLITMPDPKAVPKEPEGLLWGLCVMLVGLGVGFIAWGKLAWTLLVYGVLARIPVVLITCLAVAMDWETHHTKLPAGVPDKEGMAKLVALLTPQLSVWIVFTVLVGGFFGSLASRMVRGAKTEPTTSWEN